MNVLHRVVFLHCSLKMILTFQKSHSFWYELIFNDKYFLFLKFFHFYFILCLKIKFFFKLKIFNFDYGLPVTEENFKTVSNKLSIKTIETRVVLPIVAYKFQQSYLSRQLHKDYVFFIF